MAIPEGVETVTITTGEPITLPDGTLVRGHIRFVAPALNLIDDEDFIFGGESTAELCHGEFTITLVPPDATGITPTGWTYTAIAEFENAPGWTRYVDITKVDPNVFLDDVIVLTPGDVTYPDTTFVRKAGDTMLGDLILNEDPTVPLQAATKQYVDDSFDPAQFVEITGDTMTGPLILSGNPVVALGAAPKQYVDQAEADAVTAATAAAAAESVSLSGDTMTGPLILSGAPATGLGAATKNYVDAGDDARVAVAGDTMTGPLVLPGNPASALQAAPKQYVDSQAAAAQAAAEATAAAESVSISGDTMTGALVLNADPVVALGAATKQFAEAEANAAQAAAAAESVSISGDTMTGPLVLNADPVVALGASTKQYAESVADAAQAAAEATAAAESVSISGDTMTGPLVLNADPSVALGAATKQYVDQAEADAVSAATAAAAAESVSLSGDTMTGALILNADPVAALGASTKQYAESVADAAQAAAEATAAAESVSLSGDTMTGALILNADPVAALGAATKQFVESEAASAQAAAEATAAAESVSLNGDTMTGLLILSGVPVVANGAATKEYVDNLDGANVKLTGNQTVAGVKTFTSIPVGPASDPVAANELTRKAYVDALDAANVKLTGAQTIAGVKTFSSIPVLPASDPVSANEAARKSYVDTLDAQNVKITGNQNVSGIKTFANTVQMNNAVNGVAAASLVGAEVFDSWQVSHRGRMGWGTGAATRDAFFERIDVGVLQATSQIRVTGAAPSNAADLTRKDYVDTLDGANVKLTGAQTIAGVKTFSSEPVVPTPTIASSPTRKDYVDTLDAQNVKLTGAQTVAGVKTFSSIPVLPASDPTTSEQATRKTYVDNKIASEIFARMGLDTGVLTGGEVNVNADPTKVDIGATVGVILDYVTTPTTPTLTKITYAGGTVTISNLSAPVTWLMLDSSATVIQQTTRPTNAQRRTHVQLGAVVVASSVIIADQTLPSILPHPLNQTYDLMDALGAFNVDGNILSAASTNLTLAKTAGSVFSRGFNHFAGATLTNDPHISPTASQNPVSMRYVTQVAAPPVAIVTNVDVANYDVAGTVTAIPGGANTSTIQRVFLVPLNDVTEQVVVAYGQTTYATLSDALAQVAADAFVPNPNIGTEAVLIGYIVTKKSTTDLSNTADARIIRAAKLSGNAAGASSSLSLAVLLEGAQTVNGVKTFGSIPVLPASDPTTANEATRKSYVDAGDATAVKLTGDQTVAGIKTFSSIPLGPASDPTTANQLTRKSYVDALDAANVKLTGDQTVAGIKTFSSILVLPASDPTTTNQATRKSYVDTLDGANMKLTGAQSASGVKTFTTGVVVSAGVTSFRSAIKAGATSRNTTVTPAADPDLVVAVEANSRYDVTAVVGWTNGGGGFRVDFTGPSGATMLWVDNDGSVASAIGTDLTFSVTVGTSLRGTLVTSGTAGNLTLRWAQNTSNAADTTLLAGCSLLATRIL